MGSLRLAVCSAVLAVAALTPSAHATGYGGSVSVTPSSPAPGAEAALRVSGCAGKAATAASAAFVADARLTCGGGTLAGQTRVRSSIEPGPYEVKITCAGSQVKGTIDVADSSMRPPASASASPVAPVQAGGGGSARLAAADAREAGPGTGQTVTGLILAGVAAVVVVIRGRRRSRGTG